MIGFNAKTGRSLRDKAHLEQSIQDILTTPIGSRVMRRDYGSYLFELIDQANNDIGQLRLMAATADALLRFVPRLQITRVQIEPTYEGKVHLIVEGQYQDMPETLNLTLGVLS